MSQPPVSEKEKPPHPSELAELERIHFIALQALTAEEQLRGLLVLASGARTYDAHSLLRGRLHCYVDVLRDLVNRL